MGIVASLLPPCLPEDGSTFSSVRGSRPPPSESDPAGEEGKFKIAEVSGGERQILGRASRQGSWERHGPQNID